MEVLDSREVKKAAYTKHLERRVEALRDLMDEANRQQGDAPNAGSAGAPPVSEI